MDLNETINLTGQSLMQENTIINNIILAILIVFLGLVIGRIAGRLVERIFKDFKVDATVKEKTGKAISFQKFASNLVSYTIYILFTVFALNQIGITHLLLNIIIIILVLVIISTILLSLKDSIPNMIAYRTITKKKLVRKGDIISFNQVEGKVKQINASETLIKTKGGDLIHIPNILFLKEPFIQKKLKAHKKNHKLSKFTKED